MKHITLTLLASAALAMPALVPAMAQNTPPSPQPQAQQPSKTQAKQQQPNQQQSSQQQANQQNGQQASNQPVSPRQLGRNGVRQVQQALDHHGFHAGRADGVWGPHTRMAVSNYQKSMGMQSNGKLNQKTLSDLGVKVASNDMGNSGTMGNSGNMKSQNGNTGRH